MNDFLDLNQGQPPQLPTPTPEVDLGEVVIDPRVSVGEAPMLPGLIILAIEHPRHGLLKFAVTNQAASQLGSAMSKITVA